MRRPARTPNPPHERRLTTSAPAHARQGGGVRLGDAVLRGHDERLDVLRRRGGPGDLPGLGQAAQQASHRRVQAAAHRRRRHRHRFMPPPAFSPTPLRWLGCYAPAAAAPVAATREIVRSTSEVRPRRRPLLKCTAAEILPGPSPNAPLLRRVRRAGTGARPSLVAATSILAASQPPRRRPRGRWRARRPLTKSGGERADAGRGSKQPTERCPSSSAPPDRRPRSRGRGAAPLHVHVALLD
eukprot:scaffold182_cov350-Prasinococcus_capsulatus_cf.AAC.4